MDTTYNNTVATETAAPAYSLNWHKFLIYFSLWAGALMNIVFGIMCAAEGAPLYGVLSIAAGIYIIIVRFMLANFKTNAYHHLLAAQLIVLGVDLVFMGAELSSFLSTVAVICVTYMYYKKRSDLFVN